MRHRLQKCLRTLQGSSCNKCCRGRRMSWNGE